MPYSIKTNKNDLKKWIIKGLFNPTEIHNAANIKSLILINIAKKDSKVNIESSYKQKIVWDWYFQ